MTKTTASTDTLHFMAMFTTRQSVTQSLFFFVVMNGRVRGGVPQKTFTNHNEVDVVRRGGGGGSAMVATTLIGTTKTSRTTIAGRVAHLLGVVRTHGICGHIMTIFRLLVKHSFHLKVLIVFEILCSCVQN
jgi:hypothetical protein